MGTPGSRRALILAAAMVQVVEFIGLPEAQLTLAQAVTYMACSLKSNAATVAIGEAMGDVENNRTVPVPRHLRDAHYKGAKALGHEGYKYAHDYEGGYVPQEYLGVDKSYYRPTDRGKGSGVSGVSGKSSRKFGRNLNAKPQKATEGPRRVFR